jgi:hypothetical protein
MATPPDLETRLPVWLAPADFFVDNEYDAAHWSGNAATLAQSPYFMYPVISPVWAGFDAAWLCGEIVKLRQRRSHPGLWERALVWMTMRSLRPEWEALRREVSGIRTATSPLE